MATFLEIRSRITSTKNTGQITKALQLVSAARQKKAELTLNNSRFIRNGISEIMQYINDDFLSSQQIEELPNLLINNKNSKKDLIVNIMSKRGLCGNINSVLYQKIINLKKVLNSEVEFITVNKIAQKYTKNFHNKIISFYNEIPENPKLDDVIPLVEQVKEIFPLYRSIYLSYTDFYKTGFFAPKVFKLLPLDLTNLNTKEEKSKFKSSINKTEYNLNFSIEPDPITLLNELSNLYIDLEIYEAVLSSQASEHSSRMIAMKKATDNVNKRISELTLSLNKQRQAKITKEVAEISSNL